MIPDNNMFRSFRMILFILILTSIIFQVSEMLSSGIIVETKPALRGQFVIRKTLFTNVTKLAFNYSDWTYEIPYNSKLDACINFSIENKLKGKALTWFLNAPQFYATTNLTPIIMAPSPDLVYFYFGHSYDAYLYPGFEDRDKIKKIASIFLSNDSDLVRNSLKSLNISYVIITKDDLDAKDSFLFAVFQGKFNQARFILNQSILLNADKREYFFLNRLYSDDFCTIFQVS